MSDWPPVERAIVGGQVLTFHRRRREELPRGVLVGAGRILGFFNPDDRATRRSVGVALEDRSESVMVPGFIDAHNHLPSAAFDTFEVRTAQVRSTSELIDALRVSVRGMPRDHWVVTEHALSAQQLEGGCAPTARELDRVPGNCPIAVRLGAHVMALNSRALELSGIAGLREEPAGGIVEKDAHGIPTGVVREYGAIEMVHRCFNARPEGAELSEAIRLVQEDYANSGITSVRVTGFRPGEIGHFHRLLIEDGFLRTRVFGGPRIDPTATFESQLRTWESWAAPTGFGSAWLMHDAVKIFVDHGIESVADGQAPEVLMAQENLETLVFEASRQGWAVACHAATKLGVQAAIEAFVRARTISDRPLVIEHGFDVDDEQLKMMAEYEIWWSTQPAVIGIELGMNATSLHRSRLLPIRTALRLGVRCALGSDWNAMPGTTLRPFQPMKSIALAVERRSLWGVGFGQDEAISAEMALYLHTRGAAELLGRHDLGGLWPGARADLVLLSADPTRDLYARVHDTLVEGRTVSRQ